MSREGPTVETWNGTSLRVLRSARRIAEDVERIARDLHGKAEGRPPVFIAPLKGSFVFLADLIRAYGEPTQVDFLSVTRFDPIRKDRSSVRVLYDLTTNITGRLVVVVEGIRTRGTKVEYLDPFLRLHGPQEILYCAMIRQKAASGGPVPLDSWGFEIEDEYVVGYGLDLEERFRNLPFIGAVR